MTHITTLLVGVLFVGIAIGAYAFFAPRRTESVRSVSDPATASTTPLQTTTDWTSDAGDEFSGLAESARCDLIFAVAAFDDERSRALLEHALSDPAESVSLAAAHALVSSGRTSAVESFLARNPGRRSEQLSKTLALLD